MAGFAFHCTSPLISLNVEMTALHARSKHWLAAPLGVFLLAAFFLPVTVILMQAIWTPQEGLSTAPMQRLIGTAVYVKVMLRTLEISAYVTLLCLLLGYPLAYCIHKARSGQRSVMFLLVLLPFWTSFMVKTFAWMVILGKNGALNDLLVTLFGAQAAGSWMFGMLAVLIGMVHGLLPFAVLTILPVLDAMDSRLVPAAQSMGASPLWAFLRITLPLSMPGIAAAALIVFVTSVGFFIVPALLGGPRQMMAANLIIELVLELINWPLAAAASLVMFVIVAALFTLYIKGFGIESLIGNARVAASARQSIRHLRLGAHPWLHAWRKPLQPTGTQSATQQAPDVDTVHPAWRSVAWLTIAFLALPALFLIPISFSSSGIIDWPPRGFSLRWYEALTTPAWREAVWRSFSVATATGFLSLLLAYPAARWFVQHALRSRQTALIIMLAPMLVPRVILAIGLFYLLSKLQLSGTWLALVVGHTVIALPFVMMTLIAILQAYDERLDAAAAVCGASTWQRLRMITLPVLAPGLGSAFLFAFITSLDELTIALFLTGGLSSTIPKQMWDEALLKVSPTLAAASTAMFVLMSVVVLAAQGLKRR
jgi:putative spermidine/putrescine transport system permease protein